MSDATIIFFLSICIGLLVCDLYFINNLFSETDGSKAADNQPNKLKRNHRD